ncbi:MULTISPECIES: HsdR family type I site-specific deoxyribonuclease [unclassified Nostoc]|uniref:type I restriction endonuclease subunit R n=1 Tax=unclassified Nostoc TaxID=2593658 RepID=UPI002AD1DD05|nr:HsdR family type I site-specific deoxyribonuclease [Nostoc sp. DedQUE03]MDZ7976413.1 HsdR family type I site-specific deoxyribonuclease [Nostoc sp. DedQUE03]MDZ8047584.1 HsdR family type I site-specific deoxyribonuclease [Nostoc sp. DedQUE02]
MSEASAVQRPMLKYAYQIGWEYLTSKEALQRREGKGEEKLKERYFADVLRSQLIKLNPGVVTSNNIDEILRRLRNIDSTIEGNREALNWLQGKQSIFVTQENRDRNITLIDFNNPENNIFQVTDEWSQKGVKFPNRADIIFLINGIPVAIAETKGEKKIDGLALGIDQIRRYHNQTPELLAFPQVFEVTELWNFWYGLTWNTNRKNLFEWKLNKQSNTITEGDYEEKIKTFFDHQRFLEILRYYIVFLERDDGLTKVILRQHQTRAVKKVLQRIQDPNKKRGLVWHTQGSGKTLTMITVAAQLRNISGDNTVIMIVDRNELENQLDKNLKAYSIKSYQVATSKADLEKLIQDDYRGLIVAMIHKFDKMKVENQRSTITVLVDEAHRSTGGNFGIYLMAALPNATFIGFTGTPVSKAAKGQNTFQTFGEPSDPKYSLDSYSTADSVRDGTTLKLNYALAKSEFRVPQEILETEFLQLQAAEGINDIEELDGILDRAVKLKEFLKSEDRVDKVAKFVAAHFRDYVEPMGFKAFMVGVDREACKLYKQALDKYLPSEYSTVVYSRTTAAGLREYNLTDTEEKEVRKAFIKKSVVSAKISLPNAVIDFIESRPKDFSYNNKTLTFTGYCSAEDAQTLESLCGGDVDAVTKIGQLYEDYRKALPKILIVTEKLLTGFDAPILYCMYLDKPMRDHVLLQGIARVNRPYEDAEGLVKPYGFVLDFIGIFGDKLEQALAFESGEVNDIIQSVDVMKNILQTMMENTAPEYLPLAKGWDDKAKERAAAYFADKDLREKFFKFVRQLQSIYEILSPDPDLRFFMENYQAIIRLYGTIRAAYNTSPYIDIELTAKTKELIRRNVTIGELEMPGTIHELNAQQLEQFRQSSTTDTVKVLNLSKALLKVVHEQSQ